MTENSLCLLCPQSPQKTGPLVIPIQHCRPKLSKSFRKRKAAKTARALSSSWETGNRPKTATSVDPQRKKRLKSGSFTFFFCFFYKNLFFIPPVCVCVGGGGAIKW